MLILEYLLRGPSRHAPAESRSNPPLDFVLSFVLGALFHYLRLDYRLETNPDLLVVKETPASS